MTIGWAALNATRAGRGGVGTPARAGSQEDVPPPTQSPGQRHPQSCSCWRSDALDSRGSAAADAPWWWATRAPWLAIVGTPSCSGHV